MPRVTGWIDDGMGWLTLADPEHRNVLSGDLVTEARAVHRSFVEAGVQVAILDHTGPVFSAGRDPEHTRAPGVEPVGAAFIAEIDASPLTWIAVVDGSVLGAGIHLMLVCPWVILSDRASVAVPELDAGIYPRPVGEELARVIGARRALELILTRDPLSAGRAVELGLANEVVAADTVHDAAIAAAKRLLDLPEPLRQAARTAWGGRLGGRAPIEAG